MAKTDWRIYQKLFEADVASDLIHRKWDILNRVLVALRRSEDALSFAQIRDVVDIADIRGYYGEGHDFDKKFRQELCECFDYLIESGQIEDAGERFQLPVLDRLAAIG